MARGGINKALVMKARDAVMARGDNPSIDAVRIELGNTGSKTTIHRYLKELEEQESARLDDEALLSNTLKDMVARMAARLHDEARQIVEEANQTHQCNQDECKLTHDQQSNEIAEQKKRIADLEQCLTESDQKLADSTDAQQASTIEIQRLKQQVSDQEALVEQKDSQIQSLEEKHQHSRNALEHYRQSVKEQREQDHRRHDHQIQQLRAEQRQLNQTLSVKQSDIVNLNKDNARLVSELSELRKQLSESEGKIQGLKTQAKAKDEQLVAMKGRVDDQTKTDEAVASLTNQMNEIEEEKRTLEIELAKLKTELEVKNLVFEKVGLSG